MVLVFSCILWNVQIRLRPCLKRWNLKRLEEESVRWDELWKRFQERETKINPDWEIEEIATLLELVKIHRRMEWYLWILECL